MTVDVSDKDIQRRFCAEPGSSLTRMVPRGLGSALASNDRRILTVTAVGLVACAALPRLPPRH